LTLPPIDEERRKELVKVLRQKLESGRIVVRQIRQERMQSIRRSFDDKEISEDERFLREKQLQELTDEYNKKIEEIGQQKEEQLMTV